jgi:hypothetical protein
MEEDCKHTFPVEYFKHTHLFTGSTPELDISRNKEVRLTADHMPPRDGLFGFSMVFPQPFPMPFPVVFLRKD